MPEGMRSGPGERVPANPRLVRSLGSGRLCVRVRLQTARKVSSAHCATRHSRGQGCGAEYRAGARWPSSKGIFLQDDWVARFHRPPDRRGADFRLQLLRLLRVVAMAHDLLEQIAWLGQEGSRRLRLDAGP